MKRREFLASSILTTALPGAARAGRAGAKRCTLLHVTDTHGQLEPHHEYLPGGDPPFQDLGGFARLKRAIDVQRDTSHGPAFLVDGGDLVMGSGPAAWSTGEIMIAPANALGFDAFVPGNWEPTYGPDRFRELMGRLKTRVTAFNFHEKATGRRMFDPAVSVVRDGVKVTFVGVADPPMTIRQAPRQVEGLDSTRLAGFREFLQDVRRKEHPDLLVAVTHTGLTISRRLARENPELDVVLSGHTHERTWKPIVEGRCLIVEAGAHGSFLGRLDLTLKPDGGIASHAFRLIPIAATEFGEDPAMRALVERELAPYRERMRRVVGRAAQPIYRYDIVETNADNLISDAVRQAAGVDVGLTNGFRFAPPILPGPLTERDTWDLLPMDARIKKGWVTGRQLRDYLERELELVFSRDPWTLSGGWGPRASGLEFVFQASAPLGQRLRSLNVRGEPVINDRRYTIAGCEREGEPLDVVCRHRGTRDVEYIGPSIHEVLRRSLGDVAEVAPRRDGRAQAEDLPGGAYSQDEALSRFYS